MNLVATFIDILDNPKKYPDVITVDDFFDLVKIPKEDRSDFGFAAIIKQAMEARNEN